MSYFHCSVLHFYPLNHTLIHVLERKVITALKSLSVSNDAVHLMSKWQFLFTPYPRNWCRCSLQRTSSHISQSTPPWAFGGVVVFFFFASKAHSDIRCEESRGLSGESQSLFRGNADSITITGTHNWHVRSLSKTTIIISCMRNHRKQ